MHHYCIRPHATKDFLCLWGVGLDVLSACRFRPILLLAKWAASQLFSVQYIWMIAMGKAIHRQLRSKLILNVQVNSHVQTIATSITTSITDTVPLPVCYIDPVSPQC
eukprot:6191998-Pleurochrysis_carterae.AAC.1